MRARVLHLGVTTAAAALLSAALLPGTSWAASTGDSGSTLAAAFGDDLGVEWVIAPPSSEIGQPVTFKAKVSNVGTSNVNRIAFTVTLPATFGYVSHNLTSTSGGWDACTPPAPNNSGHVVCKHQTPLAPGESAELEVKATPLTVGDGVATATVSDSDGDDSNAANNTAERSITVTAPQANAGKPKEPDFPAQPPYPPGPSPYYGGGYGGGYYGDWDDCWYSCF